MGAFLFRSGFAMWTMSSPKGVQKQSHSCSCQGCKETNDTGTLLNLPKPASGTCTSTHRNSPTTCLRNLHQHTPDLSGTCLQNLHQHTPDLSKTCLRNLHQHTLELSGTCLRNLHQHTGTLRNLPPEPTPAHAGTLRNLPPEPTPAHTGTLRQPASGTYTSTRRNSPEPASGTYTSTHRNSPTTCLRNLHKHTPELSGTFWNLPPEPAPQTRTGTHRSLSGLKTPLAYAVGEKHTILLNTSGRHEAHQASKKHIKNTHALTTCLSACPQCKAVK